LKISTTKVWRFQKLPYLCSTHLKITVMNKRVLELMQEEARQFAKLVGKTDAEANAEAAKEESRLKQLAKENTFPY
jgi:hypothetical protein